MIESYQVSFDLLVSRSAPPQEVRLVFVLKACFVTQLITLPTKKRRLNPRCVRKFVSIAARCFYIKYILSSIGWKSDSVFLNIFCCRTRLQKYSNAMFFLHVLRWCNSCWCVNRRGFERLDASHGLKFSCRARICQVHSLPVLNHRPSLYCLMSPSILLLACVAFMCCIPRLSTIFCLHRNHLVGPVACW